MDELRIKILDDRATPPRRAHPTDAGLDLAPISSGDTRRVGPGETSIYRTGIAAEIPTGYFGLVVPRSSAKVRGLSISGVIDSSYRGDIRIVITNASWNTQTIRHGEHIAQLIIIPCETPAITIVNELSQTDRGTSGFGSSDK